MTAMKSLTTKTTKPPFGRTKEHEGDSAAVSGLGWDRSGALATAKSGPGPAPIHWRIAPARLRRPPAPDGSAPLRGLRVAHSALRGLRGELFIPRDAWPGHGACVLLFDGFQVNATAILLVNCPDQPGIIARLSTLVFEQGGNIVDSDHHTDRAAGRFLGRIEWVLEGFRLDRDATREAIAKIMASFGGQWELHHSDRRPRLSIWCSKQDHCLLDLLWRHRAGELDAEIPLIEQDIIRVSHRDTVEDLVRKGRDLERVALSRAVRLHLQHRVLTYNNRTVVFE